MRDDPAYQMPKYPHVGYPQKKRGTIRHIKCRSTPNLGSVIFEFNSSHTLIATVPLHCTGMVLSFCALHAAFHTFFRIYLHPVLWCNRIKPLL